MSNRIRGITVEIGGNTVGLQKALNDVNKQSRNLTKELKDVERGLKFNPNSTELVAQKQQLLAEQVENTSKKLSQLKEAERQVQQQFERGDISAEQYRGFRRELEQTESSLQNYKNQIGNLKTEQDQVGQSTKQLSTYFSATGKSIDDYAGSLGSRLVNAIKNGTATSKDLEKALDQIGREAVGASGDIEKFRKALASADGGKALDSIRKDMQELQREAKETEKAVSGIGDGIKGAAGAIAGAGTAGAVMGLVEGSDELNRMLARLEINAKQAGVGMDDAKESMSQFELVNNDAAASVEATSNLIAAGFDPSQILAATDAIAGAAIKWSDTLNVEGLSDAVQETIAGGQSIGMFDELLSRSGINIETFNERMAGMSTEAERQQFVLETLTNTGLANYFNAYKEGNPEMIAQQEAQQQMNQALADLSIALSPIATLIAGVITKITEWAAANPGLAQAIAGIVIVLGTLVAAAALIAPIFTAVLTAVGLAGAGIAAIAVPIGLAIAAIGLLAGAAYLIISNWETISKNASRIWGAIKDTIAGIGKTIYNFVADNWKEILAAITGPIGLAVLFVTRNWSEIEATTKRIFSAVLNFISGVIEKIKGFFSNLKLKFPKLNTDVFSEAVEKIKGFIERIKGFFSNLKLKIPKIEAPKLPRFSIKGDFSLNPPSVPRLSVDWYKKGGVFGGPSIIGVGEEPGVDEAVLPLKDSVLSKIGAQIAATIQGVGGGVTVQQMIVREEADIRKISQELYRLQQRDKRGV